MPEKYIVKLDGKEVWTGMATSEGEAKAFACADHPTLKPARETMVVMMGTVDFIDTPKTIDESGGTESTPETTDDLSASEIAGISQELKKTRQTRKDKGSKHQAHADRPAKKARNRGQFFVFVPDKGLGMEKGLIGTCATHLELTEYLDQLTGTPGIRVFQGREVRPERKIQFTLKPVAP